LVKSLLVFAVVEDLVYSVLAVQEVLAVPAVVVGRDSDFPVVALPLGDYVGLVPEGSELVGADLELLFPLYFLLGERGVFPYSLAVVEVGLPVSARCVYTGYLEDSAD
jgi:hypothetical protein